MRPQPLNARTAMGGVGVLALQRAANRTQPARDRSFGARLPANRQAMRGAMLVVAGLFSTSRRPRAASSPVGARPARYAGLMCSNGWTYRVNHLLALKGYFVLLWHGLGLLQCAQRELPNHREYGRAGRPADRRSLVASAPRPVTNTHNAKRVIPIAVAVRRALAIYQTGVTEFRAFGGWLTNIGIGMRGAAR